MSCLYRGSDSKTYTLLSCSPVEKEYPTLLFSRSLVEKKMSLLCRFISDLLSFITIIQSRLFFSAVSMPWSSSRVLPSSSITSMRLEMLWRLVRSCSLAASMRKPFTFNR